jgi:hypothetical protein
MADGSMTLEIDAELAERLRVAAEAAGESIESFARRALFLFSDDYPGWDEDLADLEEYDRTGVGEPAAKVMSEFRASVEAHFSKRR